MRGESFALPEGVIDVSILIPACFTNPLKEDSVAFISEVLTQRRQAILLTTAIVGAYHIVTRYLRVPRIPVKQVLEGILRTGSNSLYPHVSPEVEIEALDYAVAYDMESWNSHLVSLARSLR